MQHEDDDTRRDVDCKTIETRIEAKGRDYEDREAFEEKKRI